MSKGERKFFQPIPLSSILDPTYKTPFSKLQQFQVDMEIQPPRIHHRQPVSSVWRKLQSSLLNAMSNLVSISHPVFASTSVTTSLVPWRSFKTCDFFQSEPDLETKSNPNNFLPPSENLSLYYSIRSGLQYLRYYATHRIRQEGLANCKQNFGGVLYLPLSHSGVSHSAISCSEPSTPLHRSRCQLNQNLFALAMGNLLAGRDKPSRSQFYNSLLYLKGSRSTPASPMTSPSSPYPSANIEIFIRSATPNFNQISEESSDNNSSKESTPTHCWMSKSKMAPQESGFHTVSVCSTSSNLTISCSSTLPSSPKQLSSCLRRKKTESESSTDSFIEFSASVESADSFCIVFEPAGGAIDEDEEDIDREDEEDEWEDESDCDDSEDDNDRVLNYAGEPDDLFMDAFECEDQVDLGFQPGLERKKKKNVSFKDDEELVQVFEFEDDADSQKSRELYWEMIARDHVRFQDRVYRTELVLEEILEPAHRSKIFKERFAPLLADGK